MGFLLACVMGRFHSGQAVGQPLLQGVPVAVKTCLGGRERLDGAVHPGGAGAERGG